MSLPLPPGQQPRQWQLDALEAIRSGIRKYRSVLVSAATGTGKGSLIAGLCLIAEERGKRTLVLAHREELVMETPSRIRAVKGALARVGVIGSGNAYGMALSTVSASVQSLTKSRLKELLAYGGFDMVITDEAHHATAPTYARVYAANAEVAPAWRHVGLTATPFRSGANGATKGLGKVFEALVYEYGIADAISNGDLVPLRALQVSTTLSLEGVRVGKGGDFLEEDLASVVDCDARNELVVDKYLELGEGRPCLVFAASVLHAQHLAEAFKQRGVTAAAVWGEMGDARRELVHRFRNRPDELPVLCSKDLIFEGFDAPRTGVILKARPTKSRIVFQQMIGRGLRLYPGKAECLVVDLVDNGCELDLATVADLSETTTKSVSREPLTTGDRVVRRHHDDWGVGTVVDVAGDVVTVQWPVSRVHPTAARLTHPALELQKVRDPAEVRIEVTINPKVTGVRTYEVMLLGSGPKGTAIGWYGYDDDVHVVGGTMPDGTKVSFYVEDGDVWRIQSSQHDGRWVDVVELLGAADTHEGALRAAEDEIREQGVKVAKVTAEWKGDIATDAQKNALERWGVKRDLSGISKGEASALLDAAMARRKVRDAARRARREQQAG